MIGNLDTAGDTTGLRSELAAIKLRLDSATIALRRENERSGALLATLRSLFSHGVAFDGTNETIADHFRGRLETLARYHHNPTTTYDLEMLIREELRDFQFGEDARITLAGRITSLQHAEAQALGLAVHELVTNALKFGALSHRAGRLDIGWSVVAGELRLEWTESGTPGETVRAHHYGVGRDVIEQALPNLLAAQTSFALHPDGLRCQISFMLKGGWETRVRTAINVLPEQSRLQ
ncbi:sensor histidine kinase [Sphingomonas sp. PAMC 26605]|uniref:sensor histidine kinase n=1 Tax=Sphingomonas sp. PAMC 26605 TaxID=1112214 RepID=UPI00026CCB0D|nr:sensor histidine kinase [Sphingomonas sp. PAMC 26605]